MKVLAAGAREEPFLFLLVRIEPMATIEEQVLAFNRQGIALAGQGRLDEAADCFRRAQKLMPGAAAAHNNLGNILFFQRRYAEAVLNYRTAARLLPNDAVTYNNLGNSLRLLNETAEAVEFGRRAVALKPDYAEAHSNLALALESAKRYEEALFHAQRALELRPDFPEGHTNLGVVLRSLGCLEEAIAASRVAVRMRPDDAEACHQLGFSLLQQERWEEAASWFRRTVQLRPDRADAHVSLAVCCWRQDLLDESLEHCRAALGIDPDLSAARNTLGAAYLKLGRYADAIACFDESLRLEPDLAEAHFNRAMVLLLQGQFEEGWHEYQWRWKCKHFVLQPPQRPAWDGIPLAGRSILLIAEQGLGDTLHFIRYAPLVKKQAGTVTLACNPRLFPLLERCAGIDHLVPRDAAPDCDTYAPLLNLPSVLGAGLDTLPREIPYLHADENLVQAWRRELASIPGVKVGIAWQGNSQHPMDRQRSAPLSRFEPLALAGVHLISLQKGTGSEQREGLAGRFTVTDFTARLDESGAFMDTAAVMKNLDLVITTDTAVAHLAGGLGVPVWVALPFVPDWRWLLDREDSPWYPTMRLFRQRALGQWEEVFARMATELSRMIGQRPRPVPLQIEVAPGELIDKITILEIKQQRIAEPAKRANVSAELELLVAARDRAIPPSPRLAELTAELKQTNRALWDIEDAIRACERTRDFGPRFIELARSVYHQNDRRALLKRQINELLGSSLIEEKSYTKYAE
jgi:tetratricopeptide (TPR) repeat protein